MVTKDRTLKDAASELDAALSRLYREAAPEQPSADLDAAILAAARREAGSGPRRLAVPRSWWGPLSIAAVIVLSVSVLVFMTNQYRDPWLEAPRGEPRGAARSAHDATLSADSVESQLAPAEKPPASTEKSAPPKPPPATVGRADPRVIASKSTTGKPPAIGGSTEQEHAPALAKEAEPFPKAPAPALSASDAGQAASAAGKREMAADLAAESEAPSSPPAAAPRPPAAEEAAGPRREAKGERRERAAKLLSPSSLREELSPEEWLKRIEELRRQDMTVEAERSLAEFKQRYPDYPVPESLR
jgi:hypothetical protein